MDSESRNPEHSEAMTVLEWINTRDGLRSTGFRLVPRATIYNHARISGTGKSARIAVIREGESQPRIQRYIPLDWTVYPEYPEPL